MIKKWIFAISVLFFTLSGFSFVPAPEQSSVRDYPVLNFVLVRGVFAQAEKIQINFFYSAICSHCKEEEEFLKTLKLKYPEVEIKEYEVISSPENQKILQGFYEKYKVPEKDRGWVPVTFTPTKYFIGFSQQVATEIENCIKVCLDDGKPTSQKIKIPIFGEVDLLKLSLPALTVILGALDGLNPCAMWVLLFLIALLMNTRSRKRMWLIGGTFILASGIVYYLILGAWLKLFLAISYVNLTRKLIGVFALGLGIWQIRNFSKYKGACPIISDGSSQLKDKLKNNLKNRAQNLAISPLTLGILGGIILLAAGVNLIEFFCSAGLPAVYTRILALNKLSALSYYLYLLLYTFVFMLDDLIILSLAVITFSRIGFTEKYNYWSTLIGGLLILLLGVLLIFKPEFLMFG